jgi:hypothetical protein
MICPWSGAQEEAPKFGGGGFLVLNKIINVHFSFFLFSFQFCDVAQVAIIHKMI